MKTLRRFRIAIVVLIVIFAQQSTVAQNTNSKPSSILVFMTDFGHVDDSVAICKGVMLSVAPDLRIVDITHDVTPFLILDGARFLAGAAPYYPAGTVFVVVVDPGVGSARKAIAAKSKRGQYFVLPDNGLLTLIQDQDGIEEAREITNPAWMAGSALSSTFHGRDIFSPVGAHIARGNNWQEIGPAMPVSQLVRLSITPAKLDTRGLEGAVIALDGPYGNIVTNISQKDFAALGYSIGDKVSLTVGKQQLVIPFEKTFSDVPLRHALLYIDSRGHMALAINQGNFARTYGLHPPLPLFIPKKKEIDSSAHK